MSATPATFTRASKAQAKARLALVGPAGSGKTFSALAIGGRIAERCEGNMAVIDTERGSASLYADKFNFDVMALANHNPRVYIEAIDAAVKAGYAVLVIDSLSHAWMGKDGAIEQVDKAAARSQSGNSFAAWREITPLHNRLVDAMLAAPLHIIVTMRSKTEWVLEENSKGKKTPRKVGMAPIMRDGIEYEFTISGDISIEHQLVVTKSRCDALADAVVDRPGAAFADELFDWLNSGVKPTTTPVTPPPTPAPNTRSDRRQDTAMVQDLSKDVMTNAERLRAICRQAADEFGMDEAARTAVRGPWQDIWKRIKADAGHGDIPLNQLSPEVMDDLAIQFRYELDSEGK